MSMDSDWLMTKHPQFPVSKFLESFCFIKCYKSEVRGQHFEGTVFGIKI